MSKILTGVYRYKDTEGVWHYFSNLKGREGDQGEKGDTGTAGIDLMRSYAEHITDELNPRTYTCTSGSPCYLDSVVYESSTYEARLYSVSADVYCTGGAVTLALGPFDGNISDASDDYYMAINQGAFRHTYNFEKAEWKRISLSFSLSLKEEGAEAFPDTGDTFIDPSTLKNAATIYLSTTSSGSVTVKGVEVQEVLLENI